MLPIPLFNEFRDLRSQPPSSCSCHEACAILASKLWLC